MVETVETVTNTIASAVAPSNLPTGNPAVGYAAVVATEVPELVDPEVTELSQEMQELENLAHTHRVLISGDAMQHFINVCHKDLNRRTFLEKVITEAKVTYPTEDGWVVLNCDRMEELTAKREELKAQPLVVEETIVVSEAKKEAVRSEFELAPVTNSLAEAIIEGNVVAAYQLIGQRPMIALAGASADFDALYRHQNGESVILSDMLKEVADQTPHGKVQAAIEALTQTIDGTYPSEEAAVKVAIMKAIKALA